MANRWVGITVSGDKVTLVDADITDSGPIVLLADQSWNLQKGDRADAYHVMYQQISDYLTENGIKRAIVKKSALSTGSTKLSHLNAAELRGVVIAASAAAVKTRMIAKAHMSRTFGSRKVDEYVADDDFWTAETTGATLRKGSREAAMVLLAARNEQ